ncbi:Receptor-type tyrosine-protein phosphatase kappa [Hypsibius exemplaris]|uniref:Receptor-type tyrosine-protein phosphatase kappa n=1 Tax=Hypsibius exemplaris TaxID=2072580 RepID=A0A1W0WDK0_HYPEX|nr:Receptor-type tyrosine-protein phosphatase kappa [Hypsibius exemplaris]
MLPPPMEATTRVDSHHHVLVPGIPHSKIGNGSTKSGTGALSAPLPLSLHDYPPRPRSALSFNFCPGGANKKLTADEQRALTCVPLRPFDIKDFAKQVLRRKKNKAELKTEFLMVAKNAALPCSRAKLQVNVNKNSFPKVLPYDETRVLLLPLPHDPTSDYINASYIDSFDCPRAYIATQGPSKRTAPDFWRMVWQERSGCIIMLTRVFDFIKVVCVEYWTAINDEPFGDIYVTVVAKETLADFIVRTIRLRKGHEEREIKHFQFLEWPMHRIPPTGHILEFRRRILSYLSQQNNFDGPLVIHCCDGASRTGVYIALDVNLRLLETEGQVDIYGYVKLLRQMRPYMVENKQQYRFLYEAVLEKYLTGETVIPVLELAARMKVLSGKTADKKSNHFHEEFKLIEKLTKQLTTGVCAGGHRTDNRYKNRDVIMVPPDYARPYLTSCQTQEQSDYVNAVFVDGFQRKNDFIVAEWPQKNTVFDIWSLIYDHDCSTVILLTDPAPSLDKPSFFHEKGKQKTYGIFTPELISWQKYPNIRTVMYKIRKKTVSLQEMMMGTINELKNTQFFILECWPESNKVPTSTAAVIELFNMVDRWRVKSGLKPILIISPDGYSRAGVFCAAKIACEQITMHQEADVFLAVKTVKINRPQLVNSPMEYKYCYDLVRTYVYTVATTVTKTDPEATDH